MVAVVREALSNAARHARATAIEVTIAAADDFVVRVADDGVGLPLGREHVGNGLRNMAARAADLGGACTFEACTGGGTEVIWRIPLS